MKTTCHMYFLIFVVIDGHLIFSCQHTSWAQINASSTFGRYDKSCFGRKWVIECQLYRSCCLRFVPRKKLFILMIAISVLSPSVSYWPWKSKIFLRRMLDLLSSTASQISAFIFIACCTMIRNIPSGVLD